MKMKLIFPPPSNPTYVPLGAASLGSYINGEISGRRLSALDLNLEAWRHLTGRVPGGEAFWRFTRTLSHEFFDRALYGRHFETWETVQENLRFLHQDIRGFLDGRECENSTVDFLDFLAEKALSDDPAAVGFSVLFPDQLAFAAAIARRMRELNGGVRGDGGKNGFKIFFGGALMSAIDVEELLLGCPFIDAVAAGEGEVPLTHLLKGLPYEKIPGVYTVFNGGVHKPCHGVPVVLDNVPAPDFGLFPLEKYANPTPVLPVTLSRNCKWRRCRFCAHNFSFSCYRNKTVGMFVDDLELLVDKHRARHFYFADQYVPADTLRAVSGEIIRRKISINFHVMGRPTENYTEELFHKAAEAGCRWISWGVETGSQRLLDLIHKGTRSLVIREVLRNSSRAGISNLAMMIFGLPTSTEEDLEQTFELIDDIYPHVTAFTASSFALFEKTYFAGHADKYGLQAVKREKLFSCNGVPVHSGRLQYMLKSSDGKPAPPVGPIEIGRWNQRRQWLGEVPFEEKLCCEHFLLHAAARYAPPQINPMRPNPRKAA